MSLKLPASVEVELKYPYLESALVYVFPLRQQGDAALEERERLFGNGRKMKPAERLASLVEDIHGFEPMGLKPRGAVEDLSVFRSRVAEFFSSEDGQELAEHAMLYRGLAVSPTSIFRGGANSGVAEHLRGKEATRPVPALSDLRPQGEGPGSGVSEVSTDQGSVVAQEADPG